MPNTILSAKYLAAVLHGTVKVFTMIKTAAALQCSILSLYYHAVLPSSRMLEFPPKI